MKIGDTVRITKTGMEKRRGQYPGFNPSALTGIVVGGGFKGEKDTVMVAISSGESYSLPKSSLDIVKAAPKGYRHPDAPNIKRVEDFTEELHGSGIDYDWIIEETDSSFRASNSFHTMNDAGMYDAIVDFTVIFPKKAPMSDFKLQFGAGSQYQAQKHMLRDYLEDTIAFTLENV